MPKPKVLLDPHFRKIDEIFRPEDLDRLHRIAEVVWARDEPMPIEEQEGISENSVSIITGGWRHGSPDDWPDLRSVLFVSGSYPSPKRFQYKPCFARGIRVLSCAPAFGPMVAEMALGMALAASREIVDGHDAFRGGRELYNKRGNAGTFTLYGKTVGFVGFGGLARSLKPLLDPFGCRFLAYDPWLPASCLRRQGVEPSELEALLREAKIVFVLAAPSAENRGLLDRRRLGLLQPGSVLVLVSRAHLVDFGALTEMVLAGRFKAAIDVFPKEPLPTDHPIRKVPNVVLSAHRAGSVAEGLHEIGRMVVDDLEAMLNGLPPMEMQVVQPEIVRRLE